MFHSGCKTPFDIRSVRWVDMIDAEGVVVLAAHLGGQPVALDEFDTKHSIQSVGSVDEIVPRRRSARTWSARCGGDGEGRSMWRVADSFGVRLARQTNGVDLAAVPDLPYRAWRG